MSYVDQNAAFASGIQELSFDEIEEVGGGPVWLVPVVIAVLAAGLASEVAHHHL